MAPDRRNSSFEVSQNQNRLCHHVISSHTLTAMTNIRNLSISLLLLLWPLLAAADRFGIQEALEGGGGGGDGMKYFFGGAVFGASIGYVYSLYYNSSHDQKIAADGCIIVGGLLGAFVLPFIYIAATK